MAYLTFITTCRGRLAHLQASLPTFVVQPECAVVVVDYGCPERAGDWVDQRFPAVEVVRDPKATRFELGRARNLGAAAARSPWLCFVDADALLAPDFADRVCPVLQPGHSYQARPRTIETWGTFICASDDFDRVGGYDEVIQGWGKEDDDLYARLVIAGVRRATFPGDALRGLTHDDAQRVAHYEVKDRWLSESVNHVYCRAKLDLLRLQHAPVPLGTRRELYAQVSEAVRRAHETGDPLVLEVPFLVEDTRACGPIEARLTYTLPSPRGEGSPKRNAASVIPQALRR